MRETIKINDNTWRIEDDFVRFFVLAGTEKALLIDSGVNSPDAKELAESLTGLPVQLVNTHGDGDHISGNGAFGEFYMHPADFEKCGVAKRFPDCRCLPVEEGMIFDLGGRKIEIIEAPGHTYGSIMLLDAEQRVLYTQDTVQAGGVFLFGQHRQTEALAGTLEKLLAMRDRFDTLFPSHDAPVLDADHIRKVQKAWNSVCEGKVEGHPQNMFGNEVMFYQTEACGFICDKE